jgi:predicted amino acid dehydrogenase
VTADLSKIIEADLILTGASAQKGFLNYSLFKNNAVVVDIAVPANITPKQLEELRIFKPNVTYILGGIAKMPQGQHLDARFFPLPLGESYACLAETISLGFDAKVKHLNIGQLDKQMVINVERIAKDVGFSLASFKTKNSI